jgi:hypothetical protein
LSAAIHRSASSVERKNPGFAAVDVPDCAIEAQRNS